MSTLVDPALFLEWVHWARPHLSASEKRAIQRVRSGHYKRIGLDLVERIMFRAGAIDQLHVFYPLEELACRHGHLWVENEKWSNDIRYCGECNRERGRLRYQRQLRLF